MKKSGYFLQFLIHNAIVLLIVVNDVNNTNLQLNYNFRNNSSDHVHRHHHELKKVNKGFFKRLETSPKFVQRCRRYSDNYNRDYNVLFENGQYYYYPPISRTNQKHSCNNYCYTCPTYSCRRNCPSSKPSQKPRECNCNIVGSKYATCDVKTGQCFCNALYVGKTCDRCMDGYWMTPDTKCIECNCNVNGSVSVSHCQNGQCDCKFGVAGPTCDKCLPNHYGDVQSECKKCNCKPEFICEPKTGECICPPNTEGPKCNKCKNDSWNFEPRIGCKLCNCSSTGSTSPACGKEGRCTCKIGYEGKQCTKCSLGYYGYPRCTACNCSLDGTSEKSCSNGTCGCADDGNCKCKDNVTGKQCNQCKPGHFALSRKSMKGCTKCFCFGRSEKCEESKYSTTKIRSKNIIPDSSFCNDGDSCYKLEEEFLSDKTNSYGGYLTVEVENNPNNETTFIIAGNKIVIESIFHKNEVQLIEDKWRIMSDDDNFCEAILNRECLMTVLQNISNIFVVFKYSSDQIDEVLLDITENSVNNLNSETIVEKCDCPKEYTSLSCQDPNEGFYRSYNSQIPIDKKIGKAEPCKCNGHSKDCDRETGFCKNCQENFDGKFCESCKSGYYLDETRCLECPCPSKNNSNAESCEKTHIGIKCYCKKGYIGEKCDRCDNGYYKLKEINQCASCKCNPHGSTGSNCEDGICTCKNEYLGDKCDECKGSRKAIIDGKCEKCGTCSQILFNDIDTLTLAANSSYELLKTGIGPPWKKLLDLQKSTKELMQRMEKIKYLLKTAKISELDQKIENIENRLNNSSSSVILQTQNLEKEILEKSKEIEKLRKDLKKLIKAFDNSGRSHTSIKKALSEAKNLLLAIEGIRNVFNKHKLINIQDNCVRITRHINTVYMKNSTIEKTKKLFQNVTDVVGSLASLNKDADTNNKWVTDHNKLNFERIARLRSHISRINSTINSNNVDRKSANVNLNESLSALKALNDSLKRLQEMDFTIFKKLEDDMVPSEEELQLEEIIQHVENLENSFLSYQKIFEYDDTSLKKINASGAFKNIINGIIQAKEDSIATIKLLDDLNSNLQTTNTSENPDIYSIVLLAETDRQLHRIQNMKSAEPKMLDLRTKMSAEKDKLYADGRTNNKLSQKIQILREKAIDWTNIISNISSILDKIKDTQRDIDTLNTTFLYDLQKKFSKYLQDKEKLDKTNGSVQIYSLKTNVTSKIINSTLSWRKVADIKMDFAKLEESIQLAKQLAGEIKLKLNLSNCSRKYITQTSGEKLQRLNIVFQCGNCTLFSSNNILIEIVDRKLWLSVNDQRINEHDEIIIPHEETILEFVYENDVITFGIKNQIVSIKFTDPLVVGEFVKIGKNANNENGSMSELKVNDEDIGLWNFYSTRGACNATGSKTQTQNINFYLWNDAYKTYNTIITRDPTKFTIPFTFSTFDENSLIYLAYNESNKNSFILISMQDGRVAVNVTHINNVSAILATNRTYNDGLDYKLTFSMSFDQSSNKMDYSLMTVSLVKDLKQAETVLQSHSLKKKYRFRLKQSKQHVGGIPPYHVAPISIKSFKGYLKAEELSSPTSSYGVIDQKRNFSIAYFPPGGCLNITENFKSIRFRLTPLLNSGVVLTINNFRKLVFENSNLLLRIHNNKSSVLEILNGVIQVRINNDKLDENEFTQFSFGCVLEQEFTGYIDEIYINDKKFEFSAETSSKFKFHHVEIGTQKKHVKNKTRPSLKMLMPPTENHAVMQNTEGCAPIGLQSTDEDAANFGDKPYSYRKIEGIFSKNYSLKIEFRTFYPNGLIFISSFSNRNEYFNYIELYKGKLQLYIKNKRKKILFNKVLNDLKWHSIEITSGRGKKKHRLTAVLDGNHGKVVNIPKNTIKGDVYIGGFPKDFTLYLKNQLHPFRGCMKFPDTKNAKNVIQKNIGQCFPVVEEGAYFGGDSHAVYKRKFHVNRHLEFSFQFKTAEQSGILLSVSNYKNSPALSVELQNGAVAMSVDTGLGRISSVKNNLDSEFALCNNKWHNLTALYSNNELTVNIDSITKTWVQSEPNDLMEGIYESLYIGGLPAGAPVGTLKTRENYKGCIRNLKIDNTLMDWTDMEELNNILLNSCPIA